MAIVKKNGDFPVMHSFPNLLDVDRFFDDTFRPLSWMKRSSMVPAVNIRENESDYLIEVAAPGLEKKDFDIEVEDEILVISAEREDSREEKDEKYTRKEYNFNSFTRSFTLPEDVKQDMINAHYEDGILLLTLPKKEMKKAKPRKEVKIS